MVELEMSAMKNIVNSSVQPVTTKYERIGPDAAVNRMKLGGSSSGKRDRWRGLVSKSILFKILGYASIAIVPLSLAIWLPLGATKLLHVDIFESTPLGGSLTLTQAKAVDFVSGAILAPLLLTAFNYVWFANARTSIADNDRKRQNTKKGTPLHALVEASSTTSGTYNPFKIWTLFSSQSGRLMVFAVLALFAALSKDAFANVIAYEAFMQGTNISHIELRTLSGPFMSRFDVQQPRAAANQSLSSSQDYWSASYDQLRTFVQDTTGVLQQVAWQNATHLLDDAGAYVAFNVTTSDLAQKLNSTTVGLHDLPAIRATIECQAHNLSSFRYYQFNRGVGFQLQFDQGAQNSSSSPSDQGWIADIPATPDVFTDGDRFSSYRKSLDFVAYNDDTTSMFVGSMGGVAGPLGRDWVKNNTVPLSSPFGDIQATYFDTSSNGTCADAYPCQVLVWGIKCTINQQQGLMNLTRASADGKWTPIATSWSPSATVRASILSRLSVSFGPQQFQSYKAGLGALLAPSAQRCNSSDPSTTSFCDALPGVRHLNYMTLAHNVLYAEMETQGVAYEVGAMNQSLATATMYDNIESVGNVQRYRITYIPALLFAGLVCIFVAAVLTVGLITYAKSSVSNREFRPVNNLRLLMDCLANLEEENLYTQARSWSDHELEDWAKKYKVKYLVEHASAEATTRPTVVIKAKLGHTTVQ